ncbi:nascent polypeptide-associated complex subunit alpha, muscle-specific form-like [Odocoileus virginianus]|uniref:Nascent polypeptide-associated complex subunit alpha, muscle-specific form-like n=1 Tax=Odocoileus virginianus TaxID=9874 RepID=A0ABM4GYV1_ODOVR
MRFAGYNSQPRIPGPLAAPPVHGRRPTSCSASFLSTPLSPAHASLQQGHAIWSPHPRGDPATTVHSAGSHRPADTERSRCRSACSPQPRPAPSAPGSSSPSRRGRRSSAKSLARSAPGYALSACTRERERTLNREPYGGEGRTGAAGAAGKAPLHTAPPRLAVFLPTHPQPLIPSAQPQLHFRIPNPQPGIAALRPALTSGIKQRPSPLANPPPFRPLRPRGPPAYLGSWLLRVSLSVSPPRNCIRGQKGPVFVYRIRCRRLRWLGVVREAADAPAPPRLPAGGRAPPAAAPRPARCELRWSAPLTSRAWLRRARRGPPRAQPRVTRLGLRAPPAPAAGAWMPTRLRAARSRAERSAESWDRDAGGRAGAREPSGAGAANPGTGTWPRPRPLRGVPFALAATSRLVPVPAFSVTPAPLESAWCGGSAPAQPASLPPSRTPEPLKS